MRSINILGATGTIGQAAADVIAANPGLFEVNLLSAHKNADKLATTAKRLNARQTILLSQSFEQELFDALEKPVDITICAIVGMAGLPSMLKAIEHSKIVAIANKEPLVAAGPLVLEAARKHNTKLLPLDSEHNAIHQVFDFEKPEGIKKIILTASGGPFRTWTAAKMRKATVQEALKHPNWHMGEKITIDSASMMNKALEVIEAHYLFGIPPEKIEILIHPQSVIHSMVEYKDGSILAQMGVSDMRVPIAYALGLPNRINSATEPLDFKSIKELTFEEPDGNKFPFIPMAYECLKAGQYACLAMNAANEVAVDAFLTHRIGFGAIMESVQDCLDKINAPSLKNLQDIQAFDMTVRNMTKDYINKISNEQNG